MKLPFLEPNDPRLRKITPPIPVDGLMSAETKRDLERLFAIARPHQSDRSRPVLVGVSASQVGIPKRIILIDVAADGHGQIGDLKAFINPVITQASDEHHEWYEGCYSTAPACGIVERPSQITVQAYDSEGQPVTATFEGYVARVFQHEIDHLDGRLFFDHISDGSKLHWVENHEYPVYRDQEGWRNWAKKYPREQLSQLNQKI